jgi:hypothetical protein
MDRSALPFASGVYGFVFFIFSPTAWLAFRKPWDLSSDRLSLST